MNAAAAAARETASPSRIHPGHTMTGSTRSARITGPLTYTNAAGKRAHIPLGPCLVEALDGDLVDVIWGIHGQKSAQLPISELAQARHGGNLVMLD